MVYYAATTLLFWTLFLVWKKEDWVNLWLKVIFFLMAGWSTFNLMTAAGYIVKIGQPYAL